MDKSERIGSIYTLLPRYVVAQDWHNGDVLHSIARSFEWNGIRFTLVILPACLPNELGGDKCYFPSKREEIVEFALRRLAVRENQNFSSRQRTLYFNGRELLDQSIIDSLEESSEESQIQFGLLVLANIKYRLIGGGAELCFRPIEELVKCEKDGAVYYKVQFSQMFLGEPKVYEFCFGSRNLNKSER